MPPRFSETEGATEVSKILDIAKLKSGPHEADANSPEAYYKWDIVWLHVLFFGYFHIAAVYGFYLFVTDCTWSTVFWCIYLKIIGNLGVTAGVHRLWTHRAYKARLPLRILLAYFQSTCYQGSLYYWVRTHRLHHKFTDTDADPHNSRRGLFFCHIGFALIKEHKEVTKRTNVIDMTDIETDSVVMFQQKYYYFLMPFFCFILPALVPWYFFGESLATAWYTASAFRYVVTFNETMTVNSLNHWFGSRPYDKNICPTQNWFVHWLTLGEGSHNYHHVFPFDYKNSEICGDNFGTTFIELCAKIGWAYDLKTASEEMIRKRKLRTGCDGRNLLSEYKCVELKSTRELGIEELPPHEQADRQDDSCRCNKGST